jgi:hypothetical protein
MKRGHSFATLGLMVTISTKLPLRPMQNDQNQGVGYLHPQTYPTMKSDIYEIQVRLLESTCLVVFHCIPTNNVVTMESVTHINPDHIVF